MGRLQIVGARDAVHMVGPDIHHRDIVTAALASFEDELSGSQRDRAVARLRQRLESH